MKNFTKFSFAAILAASLFLVCSCSGKKTLYLYNWTYYTPDEVIKRFEQEFDCKVKLDCYATCDEMYAKLKAGAKGYDVVIPSNDYVSIMLKQNLIRELDQSKLTNRANINPVVLEKLDFDPNMKYCVPYAFSATGIIVNKTKVKGDYPRDYSIFADSRFAGHTTMMDVMREVIGCALLNLGYDLNSLDDAQLNEAATLIREKWSPNLVKFDAEGFGKSFAAGDFWVCQGYPEIVYGEVDKSLWAETIDFFIPEEGSPATMDCMVILKDAPNYELANEFINFIHRPEIYAIFIDTFHYPCIVNTKAAEYTKEPSMYPPEQANNCTLKADLGSNVEKFYNLWQTIRFADHN